MMGKLLLAFGPFSKGMTHRLIYEGFQDARGGGHFSGRITAASVAAGTICETVLNGLGVKVYTHIAECAGVQDAPLSSAAGL